MHSPRPEEIVERCQPGIQCRTSCGELYDAGLCFGPLMWNLQVRGADFGVLEEHARECHRLSARHDLTFSAGLAEAMQAGWIAPMKAGYQPVPMAARVARWEKDDHVAAAGSYYVHLAASHYYFGEHEEAAQALGTGKRFLPGLADNLLKRLWYVLQALNALKLHERAGADHDAVLAEIAPLVAKIEAWASLGPLLEPYLAYLHAERERVTGSFERARDLYFDAIESAHREGNTFLVAHLYECLAGMLRTRGPARAFLHEAARLYRRCRAERKEQQLLERHPELFEEKRRSPVASVETAAALAYTPPELDAGYLIRSALAISAEIEEEALLRRIVLSAMESSGARKGYLLIANGGHLVVRAESHSDGREAVRTVDQRLEDSTEICAAIVLHVFRTGQPLLLADAGERGMFKDDAQVRALGLRSVLCLPVVRQTGPIGILYLESRLAPAVFTLAAARTTEFVAAQAAISIDNARMIAEMKRNERALAREREAQAALLESEERLRRAQEIAHLGSWELDVASKRLLWSDEVYRIFGLEPQEFEATYDAFLAAVHPDDRAAVDDAYFSSVRDGRDTYEIEHRVVRRRTGEVRFVHEKCEHIRDAGGRIVRSIGMVHDITDRRTAEEALREADRRKSEFLAMLSHELRNPLTPIRNSLYILDRAAAGGDQARRAKAVIDRQVGHMARLVDDLLDVTRISRGKMQLRRTRFDLADVVHRTLEDYRSELAQAGVEVDERRPPRPVWIDADQARVAQAIGNLLQNAAKFTPSGGRVVMALEEDVGRRTAVIRVRDSGVGISAEVLPRLFEPFLQADSSLERTRGGLGLGLSLVKGLAEMHGGSVEAYSEGQGKGAEFTIRLPMGEGSEIDAATVATVPDRGSGARVLIIEDNVDAANSLREVLELGEHLVAVAHSGAEGIDKARAFRPDTVLCDIGLPGGMDGYDVARAFRADAALKDVHLIALTGYAQPEDIRRGQEAGFEQQLAKPPCLEKLEQILAEAVLGRETARSRDRSGA